MSTCRSKEEIKECRVPEPLIGSTDETRKVPFNVFDVVQFRGQGILDIDDDYFPIGFTFIEKGHDAKDLDLLDLASITDLLSDLADIKRIVVTLCLGLGMGLVGVLPRLR